MDKEDLKLFGVIFLFILYIIFGVSCAYATFVVTKETGFGGFLTGATLTLLLLIPAWYIGYQVIYKKNKDFVNDLFD